MASAGLPKNPVKNLNANTVDMFFARTMGTLKITKMINPKMYTGFRPSEGNSCRGDKNMGPTNNLTLKTLKVSRVAYLFHRLGHKG